jgi:hypothetical protein
MDDEGIIVGKLRELIEQKRFDPKGMGSEGDGTMSG